MAVKMFSAGVGLLLGVGVTSLVTCVFEDRFLSFDCPAGTTDYCNWDLRSI